LGFKFIPLSLFCTSLKHFKAVLSLFGSLGATPFPPASNAAALVHQDEKQASIQGEVKLSQQNAEQRLADFDSARTDEDDARHEGQRPAKQLDSAASVSDSCALADAAAGAAAAASFPDARPEPMSLTAADYRCCIRKWMEVPKNIF
jgi:hypothetical protein